MSRTCHLEKLDRMVDHDGEMPQDDEDGHIHDLAMRVHWLSEQEAGSPVQRAAPVCPPSSARAHA